MLQSELALTTRFVKSSARIAVEARINIALDSAKLEAQEWITTDQRGKLVLEAIENGTKLPEEVTKAFRNLPATLEYNQAYESLNELEEVEHFAGTKECLRRLNMLANYIPETSRKFAYNPFAGTDFYFARLFNETVFEDAGYYQKFNFHMWWDPSAYQEDRLASMLQLYRKRGVIGPENSVRLLCGDCDYTRLENDFNFSPSTLIVKGGHSVISFLENRYGNNPLNYGAMIIVSPADEFSELRSWLSQRGYGLVYFDSGEPLFVPFAMSYHNAAVFTR